MEQRVFFETEDKELLDVYNLAEEEARLNIKKFGDRYVLVEGRECYPFVWLETQPMGGEMYAKRNIEVALNNQLIFMENQREDGKLPGIIRDTEDGGVAPAYGHFQGYCFPYHAVNMYYLAEQDNSYLEYLYDVLEKFDNHLWTERCNNEDECLELWCEWDTGEDNCKRFYGAPLEWTKSTPPEGFEKVPFRSMDVMGYSHEGRNALAEISRILKNGKEEYWQSKAADVRKKMKEYLWREDKGAFYDRDKNSEFMDCLYQGNIKAMYFGCMDREMAERFMKDHLFNPDEFYTPLPLPSVAVNDDCFENVPINSWSGQVQSLNYQRIIRAMENYGKFYEVTHFAQIYFNALKKNPFFPQQFDPFTGIAKKEHFKNVSYGPSVLAFLEYISRLYGIHINREEVWFGCFGGESKTKYTQKWSAYEYTVEYDGENVKGYVNDKEIFTVTTGVRVICDYNGNIKKLINTDGGENTVTLNGKIYKLQKNEIFEF